MLNSEEPDFMIYGYARVSIVGRNGYAEVRLVKARVTRLEVSLGMAAVSLAGASTKGDYHVTTTYADD
jgi:hypothetical protein